MVRRKGRKENLTVGMAITGIANGGTGVAIYAFVTFLFALGSEYGSAGHR